MDSLSTAFPGQSPKFEPHVTISTNIAVDHDNLRDDVDRILTSCCIALNALPKHSEGHNWIKLGRVNSQRKYFKKLYFQVLKNPELLSFARIVRELFVILPQRTEQEHQIRNPHLFHQDQEGRLVRRKKSSKSHATEPKQVEIDLPRIQKELATEAASWSVSEYDPHLSLVYNDLHPIDNALWHTIRDRVLDFLSIDNCDLEDWNFEGNGLSWDGGVLKLVLCEGDVNDWLTLGSVELHV